MILQHNISAQKVSWVKSNKRRLESIKAIDNLYFPETTTEFLDLTKDFYGRSEPFDIIGHSSNTLFLPSYHTKNLISIKRLKDYRETDNTIICESGVSVSQLSKAMIEKGYVGFEGLTDLPGTIAAAVYGNCGCRGCSVNNLLKSFTFIKETGEVVELTVEDLSLRYRSTSIKRGELKGVILCVTLKKEKGNVEQLKAAAEKNHQIRLTQQPSGANNLGTTINGGAKKSLKGYCFVILEKIIKLLIGGNDDRKSFLILLRLVGMSKFVPYVYYWNRYMFLDETAHDLFQEYLLFIKTLYSDARLEIEIKK